MTTNVWEAQEVRVTIRLNGRYRGEQAQVKFYKGARHGRGSEQIGDAIPITLTGNQIQVTWTAPAVTPDTELTMPVHYQVERDGKKGSASSDSGDFVVWAKHIKVLPKNNADSSPLVGALFRVEQFSRATNDGRRTKVFHLGDDDTGEGTEVELTHFEEPRITFLPPFELVRWTKSTGQKREAMVRELPARAVFKQLPELGANAGGDGKLKRKQYVNLDPTPEDQRGPRNHGHAIKIKVGVDRPLTANTRVYIDVKLGNADGKFSRRNDPLPGLADFEAADEPLSGEKPDQANEPPPPMGTVDPLLRFTHWKGAKMVTAPGTTPAEFDLELGLAGGDVFTIKIGMTEACSDATLEITTWRKMGVVVWQPGASLSDCGKMDPDGVELGFPQKVLDVTTKEMNKAFIEYAVSEVREYELATFTGHALEKKIKGAVIDDAKAVGGPTGKKVFIATSELVDLMAPVLNGLRPLTRTEHPSIIVDYLIEKNGTTEKVVALPQFTGSKEVTVPKPNIVVKTSPDGRPFVRAVKLKLLEITFDGTKLNTNTQLGDIMKAARKVGQDLMRAVNTAVVGTKLWEAIDDDALAKQEQYITFTGGQKFKLTLPSGGGGGGGDSVAALSTYSPKYGTEVTYSTYKLDDAVGISSGSVPGLLMFPTLAGKLDLKDTGATIVHEVTHMIGMAYGSKADLPTYGRNRPIPGFRYRAVITETGGNVYEGKGHTGGHCAFGLNTSQKSSTTFSTKPNPQGAYRAMSWTPKCLNWGQSWGNIVGQTVVLPLCDECAAAIRAEDVSDLTINFTG